MINLWVVGDVYGGCMMCNSNVLLLQRFFYWGLELDACVNFIHVWDHAVQ